jgi:hypothetical protein
VFAGPRGERCRRRAQHGKVRHRAPACAPARASERDGGGGPAGGVRAAKRQRALGLAGERGLSWADPAGRTGSDLTRKGQRSAVGTRRGETRSPPGAGRRRACASAGKRGHGPPGRGATAPARATRAGAAGARRQACPGGLAARERHGGCAARGAGGKGRVLGGREALGAPGASRGQKALQCFIRPRAARADAGASPRARRGAAWGCGRARSEPGCRRGGVARANERSQCGPTVGVGPRDPGRVGRAPSPCLVGSGSYSWARRLRSARQQPGGRCGAAAGTSCGAAGGGGGALRALRGRPAGRPRALGPWRRSGRAAGAALPGRHPGDIGGGARPLCGG